MNKKNVFLFSGQGSQYYQMGRGLYQNEINFRKWMNEYDQLAKKLVGVSLVETIYQEDKKVYQEFSRTLYTNPAIFMVESALALTLIDYGIKPDVVIGTSMGEFAAAALAGMISHERALELVIQQAECIESACEAGTVVAIFENPALYDQVNLFKEKSELAAVNSDTHFVISGFEKDFGDIRRYLKENGIMHQRLPVSHGFHSANIDPAFYSFYKISEAEKINNPQISFISSLYGKQVSEIQHEYFWQIIREPILFRKALESLNANDGHYNYIDLGPTGTLANFTKHYHHGAAKHSQIFQIMTQYLNEVENIREVKSKIHSRDEKIPAKKKQDVAYLFPGQGSQKKGMGAGLFDEYRELIDKADNILGYSVEELCLHNPENKLNQTQFTQPVLYVVNALSYLKQLDRGEKKPDYVAGHSLGEYNALFAAGAIDFETGLKLVKKRGELMATAKDGGMAAIIGLTEKEISDTIKSTNLHNIDIANLNAPLQIVVSGPKHDILQAQSAFEAAGCELYIPLNVSGAFHSRLMEDARREFGEHIQQFTFSEIKIPIISNVLARPYTNENIKQLLTDQITHSVKWSDSIRYLMEQNVCNFVEIGPGNVLSKLITKIKTEIELSCRGQEDRAV